MGKPATERRRSRSQGWALQSGRPRLVDLRQLHRGAPWDDLWHDWREDWRHLKFDQHIEPPNWVLGDMVVEAGLPGSVFPSLTREGGVNVVVFVGRLGEDDSIDTIDPDGRLPKDQSSWAG